MYARKFTDKLKRENMHDKEAYFKALTEYRNILKCFIHITVLNIKEKNTHIHIGVKGFEKYPNSTTLKRELLDKTIKFMKS